MTSGRYNVAAGLLLLAAFMGYGFVLVYLRDFAEGKEAWVATYSTGKHFEARLAHAHGNLFAVLNIVLGLVLPRLALADGRRTLLAALGLTGMMMPLGILAEVYVGAPPIFVLVGGASMFVAMAWAGIVVLRSGLVARGEAGAKG